MTKTKPGKMYGITHSGRMVPVPADAGVPDVVICRRVEDYPDAQPPAGAAIRPCSKCRAVIAFNPAGPHQDKPKVCMQCASIQPLPIEPSV